MDTDIQIQLDEFSAKIAGYSDEVLITMHQRFEHGIIQEKFRWCGGVDPGGLTA